MKNNIVWKGIKYNSLEYLTIENFGKKQKVSSSIVGTFEGKIYKCDFTIQLDSDWEIQKFTILSVVNGAGKTINGRVLKGKWIINGKKMLKFNDLKYIDISITPFTNSLPINNLNLKKRQPQQIKVVYFDILNSKIKAVDQIYEKIGKNTFKYQNLDKSFEANLKTDNDGLAENYPKLFRRIKDI